MNFCDALPAQTIVRPSMNASASVMARHGMQSEKHGDPSPETIMRRSVEWMPSATTSNALRSLPSAAPLCRSAKRAVTPSPSC